MPPTDILACFKRRIVIKVRFRIVLLIVLLIFLLLLQLRFTNMPISSQVDYQSQKIIAVQPQIKIDYSHYVQKEDAPIRQVIVANFALYKGYQAYLEAIPQELKDYFYFKVASPDKIVVLSFDDGPLAYTPKLMALLSETNTPATFFLLCNRLTKTNSQWYDNPLFSYGLHTFSHKDYSYLDYAETKEDIDSCLEIFKKNNLDAKYFRPAFGIITQDLVTNLKSNKLEGILWNIDSLDWDNKRGDDLVKQVLENLSPGSIVLFHDGVNLTDLKRIIEAIQQQDYEIVSLEELLQYPKLNLIY